MEGVKDIAVGAGIAQGEECFEIVEEYVWVAHAEMLGDFRFQGLGIERIEEGEHPAEGHEFKSLPSGGEFVAGEAAVM